MVNRFWIILVLIICVFVVFFFAPFEEKEISQTQQKSALLIGPSDVISKIL